MMIVGALAFLFGSAVLLAFGWFRGKEAADLGILSSATALLALVMVGDGGSRWSGEVDVPWIEPLGARFHVGLDEVSWPFALLTVLLALAACVWLRGDDADPALIALLMTVTGASVGVFAALDLLVFFVFFELALIPMWFIIAPQSRRAATRFLLFTVAGSALVLVGIVVLGLSEGTLQIEGVAGSHSLLAASLIALGLAVKVPLIPLHTWLPDAHASAPTVGSVMLAGVFLKLGTYGLLRLDVQMLPEQAQRLAPILAVAGAAGIVWAGFCALAQDDLKRLVAYSSVGHMGFVVLALSTGTRLGIAAAVFGSVAHGLITGLLFLLAGGLKERHGSARLSDLGRGLLDRTPRYGWVLLIALLATAGLPGLAGFWGELLTLQAAYTTGWLEPTLAWTLLGVATAGIALATAYAAKVVRAVLQGVPTPLPGDRDLSGNEAVAVALLLVPIVALGVAPQLLLDLLTGVGRL